MINRVEALALAYYFTGDVKYSEGAAKHIRVFFLDPATPQSAITEKIKQIAVQKK